METQKRVQIDETTESVKEKPTDIFNEQTVQAEGDKKKSKLSDDEECPETSEQFDEVKDAQIIEWLRQVKNSKCTTVESYKKLWEQFVKQRNDAIKLMNQSGEKNKKEDYDSSFFLKDDFEAMFKQPDITKTWSVGYSAQLVDLLKFRTDYAQLHSETAAQKMYGDTSLVIKEDSLYYCNNDFKITIKFPYTPVSSAEIIAKLKHNYGYDFLAILWEMIRNMPPDLRTSLKDRGSALITALCTKLQRGSFMTKNQIITVLAPTVVEEPLSTVLDKKRKYFIAEASRCKVSEIDQMSKEYDDFIFLVPTGYCFSTYSFPSRHDINSDKAFLSRKYNPTHVKMIIEGSLESGIFWYGYLLGLGYKVTYLTSSVFMQEYVKKL